jgi:hypothetical protein
VQIANLFNETPTGGSLEDDDIIGNIEKLTLHLGVANIKARGVVKS